MINRTGRVKFGLVVPVRRLLTSAQFGLALEFARHPTPIPPRGNTLPHCRCAIVRSVNRETCIFLIDDDRSARDFFTQLTSLYKNWNYSAPDSPDYERYQAKITELADGHRTRVEQGPSDGSGDPETAASVNEG